MSDDECAARAICFDEENSADSSYHHRGLAKSKPSLTIVVDLKDGFNPYDAAEIGLKFVSDAIVKDATMNDVRNLLEDICESSSSAIFV